MTQLAPRKMGPRPVLSADSPPPADIAAERAVLCAVALGIAGASDAVEPREYYDPRHRRIAEAVRAMRADGVKVDVVTLASRLHELGGLDEAGGAAYLAELLDGSPDVRNLPDHRTIVRRTAQARQFDANLTTARAMLRTGVDPAEVAAFVGAGCECALGTSTASPVLGANDIFNVPDEIVCLVPDLGIKPGPPTIFTAPGGIGKSVTLQSGAVSSVLGNPWWGLFPVVRSLRVLWIDLEQGSQTTLLRFKRLALAFDLTPSDLQGRLDVLISPDVSDASKLARLLDGHDLVFIDCLRAMAPDFDENDSRMRMPIDACARASEKTGCGVVLIHHSRKDGESGKGSKRDRMRGSSSIRDAADAVFQLDRDGELAEGPIDCTCTKAPRATGRAPQDWVLEIRDTDLWLSPDRCVRNGGISVVGKREQKVDPFEQKRDQRKNHLERVRRTLLPLFERQATWRSAAALASEAHLRKSDVLDALAGWDSVTTEGRGSHQTYTRVGAKQ